MKWIVPKVWDGGQCVILGGGPSLLRQFEVPQDVIDKVYTGELSPEAYSPYLEQIHSKHTIAVNMAYKIGDWIDIVFFGDPSFWNRFGKDVINFPGLKVTCCNKLRLQPGVKYVRMHPYILHGLCSDPSVVCWNKNSGAAAINLAIHTGVKKIYLFGFDMCLDAEDNQHWHKFYAGPLSSVQDTLTTHLKGFPAIARDAKKLGVEIINVNPNSKIECFPKVALKDISW